MRVAIVGSGISGLMCAHWLHPAHEITVFEADDRIGGHTNTVQVDLDGEHHAVDTGFIVYNETNYPVFSSVLHQLEVATQPSEMSFSVSTEGRDFEYRGNGTALWAQPSNALDPSFSRLLADILSFNRRARRLLTAGDDAGTVGELLAHGRYGRRLADHYLVPLGSAIWSADPATFLEMPALTLARFLHNHGMLQLKGRPRWRTVTGGSDRYVQALIRPFAHRIRVSVPVEKLVRNGGSVTVLTGAGPELFDAVVVAVHSDQALGLLGDPTPPEREILGAIRYQPNVATLHTDISMLPRRRRAWASWNAHLPAQPVPRPTVTYWMNMLQGLRARQQLCVTLNRSDEIDPATVLGQWSYSHPVYDTAAVAAQRRRSEIQGRQRTWYCGAYWGYGFHEDGVVSALDACRDLGAPCR